VFVGDRGRADIEDWPGLAIRWADNAFPFWNAIFLTEPDLDTSILAQRLRDAASYMRVRSFAGLVWVCEEYLTDDAKAHLPELVTQCELVFSLRSRGMAGEFLPIAPAAHPSLRFARVTSEEALQAYADINANAYGFAPEAARAGLAGSALWKDTVHAYLGYEDGVPVAAAATVANDGCLFLALVATLPAAQRKGYGEATVRMALYEGYQATGFKRSVLHATDAGFPVYARVGYRPVATINAYGLA
jgi:hypothetical protein